MNDTPNKLAEGGAKAAEGIQQLKDAGAQIRDEKNRRANTALRVGSAVVKAAECLEQQQQNAELLSQSVEDAYQEIENVSLSTDAFLISAVKQNTMAVVMYPELLSFDEQTTPSDFTRFFSKYPFSTLYAVASAGKQKIYAIGDDHYFSQNVGHLATKTNYIGLKVIETSENKAFQPASYKMVLQWLQNDVTHTLTLTHAGDRYTAQHKTGTDGSGSMPEEVTNRLDAMDAKIGVIDTDLTNILEG